MRPHPKAKANPYQRKVMIRRVEKGWSVAEASAAAGWSEDTGHKWLQRCRGAGGTDFEETTGLAEFVARQAVLALERSERPP